MTFLLQGAIIFQSRALRRQAAQIERCLRTRALVRCDLDHRLKNGQGVKEKQIAKHKSDRWERQMSYLSNVVNERPMLRVAASVIAAFFFAAPLVLLVSSLVVYGVRTFIH